MSSETSPGSRRALKLDADEIQPTEKQISANVVVLPKKFIAENAHAMNWRSFAVSFCGHELARKKLDSENRVSLPLKGHVRPGETLKLRVQPGLLVVELKQA